MNPFIELGKLKGRQEGHQQGRQEGRQEAGMTFLQRLVRKKFPAAVKKAEPLLAKLSEEDRFSFGEALLFMETPAQCLAWLKARS